MATPVLDEPLKHAQARTQKFLKGGGVDTDGEFPRKNCNSIHEMALLEVSAANFKILGCILRITPVTLKLLEVY